MEQQLQSHVGVICALRFDKTGNFLASVSNDQSIRDGNKQQQVVTGCCYGLVGHTKHRCGM